MRNGRLARLITFAVFIVITTRLRAAEWQWSVPDGQARAYLWIPPDCRRVRAIVLANHNMIEQGILEHAVMRKTLAELGIAEVWVVPAMDGMFDFNQGASEHFERIMKDLAAESGYAELSVAPVVPIGHSACASYPWNFGAWNPQRTLAMLSIHGDAPRTNLTGNGQPNVDWGDHNINGVPGLMVMGEYEWWEDRLTPAFDFIAKYPQAPVSVLCDAGHGHFDYSDELVSYLAMVIRKAAEERLPVETNEVADRPVVLRAIDPNDGWRIDRWRKDQPPTAAAAPFRQYTGDTSHAFWCFDEEMARITESWYARVRGEKPQLLGFVQDGQILAQTQTHEQVRPQFAPIEGGTSFRLTGAFLDTVPGGSKNPPLWAGLPVGASLGHPSGGGPVVITRISGPVEKLAPDTFGVCLDRSVYTANRRNNDMWLLASHPGDSQYKSAVQQALVVAVPNREGAEQTIDFPAIADQKVGVRSLKLTAVSDSKMPVRYYIREGPVEIDGDTLKFLPIPPCAKFPLTVTVVAWQWGRSTETKTQTAKPVEVTFHILKPQEP